MEKDSSKINMMKKTATTTCFIFNTQFFYDAAKFKFQIS